MAKTGKGGYYAVRQGRIPGIYATWFECEAQVTGFSEPVYKKFGNLPDAKAFLVTPAKRGSPTSQQARPSSSHASQSTSDLKMFPRSEKLPLDVGEPKDIVYCRSTCRDNGGQNAMAGIGAWWGLNDPRNQAERCPGTQTNQRAELIAIIRVLETVLTTTPKSGKLLNIRSDSDYAVDSINKELAKWCINGYRTTNGSRVINAPLFRYLAKLLDVLKVAGTRTILEGTSQQQPVQGHEGAKRLSNEGAGMSYLPERDWEKLIQDCGS